MGEDGRRPRAGLVTGAARLGGRNVIAVLGRTREPAAGLVTGVAILRGALKNAALVASFAADRSVRTGQRKPRKAVIDGACRACLRVGNR